MLNFNKDESCNFLQSLLINHYFDISITSFMQQIIISYIQIFIFLLSTYTRNVYMSSTNLLNQKFSVFGDMCSSGTVRSSTSSQFISATPTTSNFALVFCRRCCHSSKTFLPHFVLYCVVFGVASDTRLVSSSLLFGERNRPAMFLLQELNVNELLNSMLNISKLLRDNSTPA